MAGEFLIHEKNWIEHHVYICPKATLPPKKVLAIYTVHIYSTPQYQQPTHEVTCGRSSNVEM